MKRFIAPPLPAASRPSNNITIRCPVSVSPPLHLQQFDLQLRLVAFVFAPGQSRRVGIRVADDLVGPRAFYLLHDVQRDTCSRDKRNQAFLYFAWSRHGGLRTRSPQQIEHTENFARSYVRAARRVNRRRLTHSPTCSPTALSELTCPLRTRPERGFDLCVTENGPIATVGIDAPAN